MPVSWRVYFKKNIGINGAYEEIIMAEKDKKLTKTAAIANDKKEAIQTAI